MREEDEFVALTQAEAVAEAVRRCRDDGGTVHVFGPPEDPDLLPGETVCGPEAAPGSVVVYHPAPVRLTTGGMACPVCGESRAAATPTA